MKLTTVFESWHIEDGNYPPLNVAREVNLSFQLNCKDIEIADEESKEFFKNIEFAEYSFLGEVIAIFGNLLIIETGDFKFYIEVFEKTKNYTVGQKIKGKGILLLDYYIWFENYKRYKAAPNLFYNFKVERIRKVSIPEQFILRHSKGKSLPTYVSSVNIDHKKIKDIKDMRGQSFDEEFYLVDLNSEGLEDKAIDHTYI